MTPCKFAWIAQLDHPGYYGGCLTHDSARWPQGESHCEGVE